MPLSEVATWIALGLAILVGIWCLVLNSRLGRVERQYRALMRGSSGMGGHSLGELVSEQSERLEQTRTDLSTLQKKVSDMDVLVTHSVQHMALVRYNPFQD